MVKRASRKKKNQLPERKHRFYCGINLDYIDGRTTLGKMVKVLQDQLQDYVGVNNILTDLLCHRIIYKTIRLSMYETAKLLKESSAGIGTAPEEVDHYLPMTNSLRLDLSALANLTGKPKPPDLNDYLKGAYLEDCLTTDE